MACQEHVFEDTYGARDIIVRDDLYATTAVGDTHMWAAGYFGTIYRTQDAGSSWERLASGTEKSIYDISFADEQNGWAVGRRGLILHTDDGGETWTRQKSPRFPMRHIFAVHAVTPKVAWTVGDWGSRYVTRDGGETWDDASLLIYEDHPTFQYLSNEDLEAFQRGEDVYDDTYLNDLFFLDEQRGWIAAEYGIIFYTHDGGETWEKGSIIGKDSFEAVQFPSGVPKTPRDQWGALFDAAERLNDKQHLRIRLEGFMTQAELRATGDTTLSDDRANSVRDFLESEGVGQDRIRILNETPYDQDAVDMTAFTRSKIRDKGFVSISVIETPFLFDVKFTDADNGVIAGLGGVVLQTADGGATWNYRETESRQALFGIGVGNQAVTAVGERGLYRRSTDGGLTFSRGDQDFQEEFKIFGFMRDIVFGDEQTGWIVGDDGLVLQSTDGGLTWGQIDVRKQNETLTDVGAGE
ncbi:MAG: hypothetical protein JRG76_12050 [Deltaproteobacteria bacterium]|nr:hypothetical protein [Deltaproteobacteria bacterium]MBW2415229.1 hypothetical protein [Deltaproteobacteria bacterium]